ncbi:MAG: hypothetical protein LBJ14_11130 [Desulfarculales bacterium]|jgi:hypothetical protein|nr:hypothetical protein [Desulfarculales bacterium]
MDHTESLIPLLPEAYQPYARPARPEDAYSLGPRLRRADADEVRASSGKEGAEALLASLEKSALAWTFLHPLTNEPQVMAGLGFLTTITGVPWLLAADLDQPMRAFFRAGFNQVIAYMHQHRRILVNMADARNRTALKWLKFVGFELNGPWAWGVEQRPFYQLVSWREKFNHVQS